MYVTTSPLAALFPGHLPIVICRCSFCQCVCLCLSFLFGFFSAIHSYIYPLLPSLSPVYFCPFCRSWPRLLLFNFLWSANILVSIFAARMVLPTSLSVQIAAFVSFVFYFLAGALHGEVLPMLLSALQYFVMLPTTINILSIYAFCNTHDLSWGTKVSCILSNPP